MNTRGANEQKQKTGRHARKITGLYSILPFCLFSLSLNLTFIICQTGLTKLAISIVRSIEITHIKPTEKVHIIGI